MAVAICPFNTYATCDIVPWRTLCRTNESRDDKVLLEINQKVFVEEREHKKLRRRVEEGECKAEEAGVRVLKLNASLETL